MISRVCYCFRLSRVSYSLYCNKLSVHNILFVNWKMQISVENITFYLLKSMHNINNSSLN